MSLCKMAKLLNLQWLYEDVDTSTKVVTVESTMNKPVVTSDQYQALIALAEIGYLSGFKDKFTEIESQYHYPKNSASQIKEYVEVCNFPKIIEYLNELNHEA